MELHPVDAREQLKSGQAIDYTPFPWTLIEGRPEPRTSSTALVVGTGPTAGADLMLVDTADMTLFAINDAVYRFDLPWAHLVTWHCEKLNSHFWRGFKEVGKTAKEWPQTHVAYATWIGPMTPIAYRHEVKADCVWSCGNPKGSSAIVAVGIALSMGFEQVVVAGCPLGPEKKYVPYRQGWTDHRWLLEGKVLGVSGWIADTFGRYI